MALDSLAAANEHERRMRARLSRRSLARPARRKKNAPSRRQWRGGLLLALITVGLLGLARERRDPPLTRHHPYRNCAEAHASGAFDIPVGDPRYTPRQDRDRDGLACEPYP